MFGRIMPGIVIVVLVMTGAATARPLAECSAAFARHDYARAAKALLPLAARGNARAQTCLGFMFATGRGVPQDYAVASGWYRRASDQGNALAQYMLGLLYDKGQGVPQDEVEAFKWLDLAVAGAAPDDRYFWARIRDDVGFKLNRDELAEAQRLAQQFRATRER